MTLRTDAHSPAGPDGPPYTPLAREWGVGACLLGMFTIVMVPACLLAAAVGLSVSNVQWNERTFRDTSTAAYIALAVCFAMAGCSFLMGGWGVLRALTRRLPAGIATTGLILGAMALAACVFGGFVVQSVKDDVRQYLDRKAGQGPELKVRLGGDPQRGWPRQEE
jgi:hypothetical protein